MKLAPGTFAGLAGPEIDLFKIYLSGLQGDGVEIGCLDGFSSAIILESSHLHLTCIDPFVPDSMEPSLIGSEERFRYNVAPFEHRWKLLKVFSQDAILSWIAPIDFLFIDGDHNYEAVLRDFDQWTPFIKKGGLLAMHDSRMSRPGGANFHPGPSQVAAERIYGNPLAWQVIGEAFSLTLAVKL